MARHFAYRVKMGDAEFKPFLNFIKRSPYVEYWAMIPESPSEADLAAEMEYFEDTDNIHTTRGEFMALHELQFGYLKR